MPKRKRVNGGEPPPKRYRTRFSTKSVLTDLPADVLDKIIRHTNVKTILALSTVSRELRVAAQDASLKFTVRMLLSSEKSWWKGDVIITTPLSHKDVFGLRGTFEPQVVAGVTLGSMVRDSTVKDLCFHFYIYSVHIQLSDHITDVAIGHLSKLQELCTLGLDWCDNLVGTTMFKLRDCPKLRRVSFRSCLWIEDVASTGLSGCPSLKYAEFTNCRLITGFSPCMLGNCDNLLSMTFYNCDRIRTNVFMDHSRVRTMRFPLCSDLADISIQQASTCRSLRCVDLSGCQQLTDVAATAIAKCPVLKSVNFNDCLLMTDAAAVALAMCPTLESVSFACCDLLTDVAAVALATCPNLKSVDFGGCNAMTDAAAVALAACPALRTVKFDGCYRLTDSAIFAMETYPALWYFNLARIDTSKKANKNLKRIVLQNKKLQKRKGIFKGQ